MKTLGKVFLYELRRLLINKFTAGFVAMIGFYSYWIMQNETILGTANTAPFSSWSFGVYLTRVLQLMLAALLFFISFLYSKQAQAVNILIDVTSVKVVHYRFLRYGTVAAAFFFLTLIPIGYAFWFYGVTFRFTEFQTLIGPLIFVIFPTFLLTMGLGILGGRIHPVIVFVLMALVLLISFVPLPNWFDFFGSAFLTSYPTQADRLDPDFYVSALQLISKVLCTAAGIVLTIFAAVAHR